MDVAYAILYGDILDTYVAVYVLYRIMGYKR